MNRPNYQELANADISASFSSRNVHDHHKHLSVEELRAISQEDRLPFAVCVLNITGELNVGTVVRNAHLTGAERVGIVGRRKFDKRGAVGAENYVIIDRIDALEDDHVNIDPAPFWSWIDQHHYVPFFVEQGGTDIGYVHWGEIRAKIFPRKICLVFGNENRGIDARILRDPRGQVVSLAQRGVIRSFNVASASSIAMYSISSQIG